MFAVRTVYKQELFEKGFLYEFQTPPEIYKQQKKHYIQLSISDISEIYNT